MKGKASPKKRRGKKKFTVAAKRRRFTKKQLALIRRVLSLKGLPLQLRQMLLVLIGASMKQPSRIPSKKTKSKKKRRASAKQLAVRRRFKAFIRKHHRPPRKGERLG